MYRFSKTKRMIFQNETYLGGTPPQKHHRPVFTICQRNKNGVRTLSEPRSFRYPLFTHMAYDTDRKGYSCLSPTIDTESQVEYRTPS